MNYYIWLSCTIPGMAQKPNPYSLVLKQPGDSR